MSPGAAAAEIVFDHVTKRYPGQDRPAVDDLTLTIPAGDICVLIGPSGGGKTTAMKLVNRLIPLTDGDITIDGTSILALDPVELRRGIGYVIQQIGLFPHMTIEANVATVPKLVGWDRERTRARARELLDLVGLDPGEYAKRYPAQLSGGQRQRVGLARAMAADPPLMLMDEPFGAIDPITRERLQNDFLRLHREVRKTVIFVTHDIDEAIRMGDRIAILRQGGRLAQYDTPEAILADPADEFVADFVGADRGLKRLGLRRLADVDLLSEPAGRADHRPQAPPETTLRDALSLMLTEGSNALVVREEDGHVRGYLTLEAVSRLLGEGARNGDGDGHDAPSEAPAGRGETEA
jgi:osmoprotectant transport system ATP-binding protein